MTEIINRSMFDAKQKGTDAGHRNAMNKLAINQATTQQENQQGIQRSLGEMGANPDRNAISGLAQYGQQGVDAASKAQKLYQGLDDKDRESYKQNLKSMYDILTLAENPETYAVGLQQIKEKNPDQYNAIPKEWSPETAQRIKSMRNELMSISQVIGGGDSAAVSNRNDIIKKGNFNEEEIRNFALYESGQRGKPTEAITLANNEDLAGRVANTQGAISGEKSLRSAEGKLDAEGRLAPNIEKQKLLAKDAGNLSTEIFGRMEGIETNIRNMEEGIKLVDEGANVGPVDKWFPSFKASSIAMDNLKNRLGLDIIGSVTFGALSKGELDLALDTAIPPNLDGPELKAWFQERIEPQRKLLESLENAGIFLAEDGATIPKLMAHRRTQRNESKNSPSNDGWSIEEI